MATPRAKDPDLGLPAPPGAIDGIRVGVGGWTFAPWRANFYPTGLVQRRELEYASRRLSAIEINGTYYSAQKPATYARWRDETPPGFVFTAKAPMRIVQSKVLAKTAGQVDAFVDGLSTLGEKLGAILWQFERKLDREDFAAFVERLPEEAGGRRVRHALEVRDADAIDVSLVQLARARNAALVYADSPDWPAVADATADFVYVRTMRARSALATGYTPAELDTWAERARTWAAGGEPAGVPRLAGPAQKSKHRDVFVFFINAGKERNPAAAMALIALLAPATKKTQEPRMNADDQKSIASRFLALAAAGQAREGAAQLVAPGFRHHNVYFAGDGASLFQAMDDNAAQFPDKQLDVMQVLQDGDKVVTLSKVRHAPGKPLVAVAHFFRFEGGKIAELWDLGQELPAESPNQYGAF